MIDRRPGYIASCYEDVSKAEKELSWTAKLNIEDMCLDSWRFEENY
jgi:UDP-glucose 4-epimerase